MRKPIKQEDFMGCGVACAAFILGTAIERLYIFSAMGKLKLKPEGSFVKI